MTVDKGKWDSSTVQRLLQMGPPELANAIKSLSQEEQQVVQVFVKTVRKDAEKLESKKNVINEGFIQRFLRTENKENVLISEPVLISALSKLGKRSINQDEFVELLKDIKKNEAPIFAEMLKKRGFSTELKNIDFNIEGLTVIKQKFPGEPPDVGTGLLKGIDFSGLKLVNCNLKYVNFTHSKFHQVEIEKCNLHGTVLKNTSWDQAVVSHSILSDAIFDHVKATQVTFIEDNLEFASFKSSLGSEIEYRRCKLTGTSFLDASLQNSRIEGGATNCLLFGTKKSVTLDQGEKNVVRQPVIGFPWNLESPGGAASKLNVHLKQQPCLPLKYDFLPDEITTHSLENEIQGLIQEIGSSIQEGTSIPKEVILLAKEKISQGNGPVQIGKILGMAKSLVRNVDAVVLPGGADIQPIFYGQTPHKELKPDPDFRRSMIEFAILNEAELQGKPVLGICRGSQLANIWHGGTMTQHIEDNIFKTKEYRVLEKPLDAASGIIREIIGKDGSILGFAVHHQEYAKIGSGLEEVIEKRALEQRFGSPQIYVQWHPEFKGDTTTEEARLLDAGLSKENINFFKVFADAAAVRRKMKQVTTEIRPEISRQQ